VAVKMPVRTLVCLSVGVWIVSAAAAAQEAGGIERILDRGGRSGILVPRQVVARTQGEWTALWQEHAPGKAAPTVDFSREMVVGVFLGSRPTAGYSVEMPRARLQGADLTVEYQEIAPPPGRVLAQVITSPFVIAVVAQRPGTVRFAKIQ
jgi:hypothetical protein